MSKYSKTGIKARLGRCFSLLCITLAPFTAIAETDKPAAQDVSILIQSGHANMPGKVIAYHESEQSFLETWDGIDVRLWRRADTASDWSVLRHWKNLQGAWTHSHNDKIAIVSANVDGFYEVYDATTYSLMYRVKANLAQGEIPELDFIDSNGIKATILSLPETDSQGNDYVTLHLSRNGGPFQPWSPQALPGKVQDFYELSQNTFAITMSDGSKRVLQIDRDGDAVVVQLDKLPSSVARTRYIRDGIFAVALNEPALRNADDKGYVWHFFSIDAEGVISPVAVPGFAPGAIQKVGSWNSGYVRIIERSAEETDEALLTHIFQLDENNQLVPVAQAIDGMPAQMRNFRVLGKGSLIGATEIDDNNNNSEPGDWIWRIKGTDGDWHTPQQLLAGIDSDIWDAREFLNGKGLGLQTRGDYKWHWYLRDQEGDAWVPATKVLPLDAEISIGVIRDRRNGLIELLSDPNTTKYDQESPVPFSTQNTRWMMQALDGEWVSVRDLLARLRPGLEKLIVAVDARDNSLMVDIKRSVEESPIRLLFYKNRDSQWVSLESSFSELSGSASGIQNQPFPQIESAAVMSNGQLVLLNEKDDANRDGEEDDIQLLQSHSDGWQLLKTQNTFDGKTGSISYDEDLGLLVRTSKGDGSRHFFILNDEGNLTDIRQLISDAPSDIESAYMFADKRGIAIKEQLDANENGQFGEWFYFYNNGKNWQDIRLDLPDDFPEIQTIIDAGGRSAISVQESGDSNGNGIASEWRHYYYTGENWVDLQRQLSALPDSLSELHVSPDGRILTVREEWDDNGNGLLFELYTAIWSDTAHRFIPLDDVLTESEGTIRDLISIWNGQGIAVQVETSTAPAGKMAQTKFTAGGTWQLYELQGNTWTRIDTGQAPVVEVRDDSQGLQLALRRQDENHWELWQRSSQDDTLDAWRTGTAPPVDIRLDLAPGLFAIKTSDLWADTEERWEVWRLNPDGAVQLGVSATPSWFGLDHTAIGKESIRFHDAMHFHNGNQTEIVPQAEIWLHREQNLPGQSNALYAPQLMARALSLGIDEIAPLQVDAIGYGASGTIIVYQFRGKRIVTAFSNGPVAIETRALLDNSGTPSSEKLTLLVNRFPDGTERLIRFDMPDRWIWSYQHKNGRIYYDDAGYFYNETDAISETLSFRVGTRIHSFAQLGSYLFRPDLLEKQLGLSQGALFELTQQDVDKIRLARKLAPEGVDISKLQPPNIEVIAAAELVDEAFVDLDLIADGFGINQESVAVRILGAGQARSVTPRPDGSERETISFTKRVSLVPGENRLEVTIYDANGLSHSQRLLITYKPKVERKPTLYAAIIATSEYKGVNRLDDLPLTQNDARTIEAAFNEQHGKRFDKVVVKTWCQQDGCRSQPKRHKLQEELPNFLSQAQNGDFIIVYVSGHGLKIGAEYFMIPEDGDPSLPSTLVSWSQMQGWLRDAKLGKKVVLLDTCQSGAVYQSQRDQRRMVQQAAEQDGIYVLSASAADSSAYELSSIGNGLFTYVVNEGLLGQADVGSDGSVSFEELSFHVARRVRELSSAQKVRMEPFVPIIDQEMDFKLVNVDVRQQLFIRVSDVSTFDNSALPERREWWEERITSLGDNLSLSNAQTAVFRLVVIEDQGEPLRGQLSLADGSVLGQWRFNDASTDEMLASLTQKISSSQDATQACSEARGLTLDQTCN